VQLLQLGGDVAGQVHPADHRRDKIVIGCCRQQPLAFIRAGDRLHEHGGSHRPARDAGTYRIVQVLHIEATPDGSQRGVGQPALPRITRVPQVVVGVNGATSNGHALAADHGRDATMDP
jgi:hypothetical protein